MILLQISVHFFAFADKLFKIQMIY